MGRLKPAFATALIICAFGIYTMIYESALILESERELFFLLRGTSIAVIFISTLFYFFSKDKISDAGNIFYVLGVNAYSIVSSLYRPWYLLSVFQFALLFAFLIPHRRWFFTAYVAFSYLLFISFLVWRWPNVSENYTQLTLEDWNNVGLQFFAMAAFVYYFFVRSGRYRVRSEMRLVSIGRNASRVMTDLNTMTSPTPCGTSRS